MLTLAPAPQPDDISLPFFEALAEGRILVQQCAACGTCQLGQLYCDECGAERLQWRAASGCGTVHSFVVVHIAYDPAHEAQVPYASVQVELDEGPLIYGQIVDTQRIRIGQRVAARKLVTQDGAFVLAFAPSD